MWPRAVTKAGDLFFFVASKGVTFLKENLAMSLGWFFKSLLRK